MELRLGLGLVRVTIRVGFRVLIRVRGKVGLNRPARHRKGWRYN